MSTTPRNMSLTDNHVGRCTGRRLGGSYGRPKKECHAAANRGVRRTAKINLNKIIGEQE